MLRLAKEESGFVDMWATNKRKKRVVSLDMWAAIKSDLREFATGAAEETNAASEKVVGKKIIPDDVNIDGVHADAKALADGVGNVMGGAMRGLVGVSSLVGGIVAPRNAAADISGVANRRAINSNIVVTATTTTTPPPPPSAPVSMALSSMLAAVAAGEDDDEEEEMGWDDDDDDVDDDDYVDDNDLDTDERAHGEKRMADNSTDDAAADTTPFNDVEMPIAAESGAAISAASHDDSKALMALQTKLASVEKSRNELQSEHRRQTAELVELRSKVKEYERQQQQQSEDDLLQKQQLDDENEGENKSEQKMRDLQLQVEQLKSQLVEQVEVLKQEHKEYVTLIQREKEELDRELNEERQRNDVLMRQNTALVDNKRSDKDEEEAKELLLHQSQINALEMELSSLRTNLDTTTCELLSVKEHMTNQVLVHQEEIQRQLAITNDIEERLLRTKEEYTRAISSEVNESKVTQTESETQTDSSVTTPPLNISPDDTASEDTVVSTGLGLGSADDVVDNNKSFATANEELLEAGAPSPSPSSGSSPDIKVDITEDELSDDWGDGGW